MDVPEAPDEVVVTVDVVLVVDVVEVAEVLVWVVEDDGLSSLL